MTVHVSYWFCFSGESLLIICLTYNKFLVLGESIKDIHNHVQVGKSQRID
jgi:hypothetical protein